MYCNFCKKDCSIRYRVTNTQSKNWLFTFKKCWKDFSKTDGYRYGGTREGNRTMNS